MEEFDKFGASQVTVCGLFFYDGYRFFDLEGVNKFLKYLLKVFLQQIEYFVF
jgi:hypothetical protein